MAMLNARDIKERMFPVCENSVACRRKLLSISGQSMGVGSETPMLIQSIFISGNGEGRVRSISRLIQQFGKTLGIHAVLAKYE
jgi:hypothetical protein